MSSRPSGVAASINHRYGRGSVARQMRTMVRIRGDQTEKAAV
jgi:hypothetical protein